MGRYVRELRLVADDQWYDGEYITRVYRCVNWSREIVGYGRSAVSQDAARVDAWASVDLAYVTTGEGAY